MFTHGWTVFGIMQVKKNESFKWQDVEVWISNIAHINAAQISIIKLYTLLTKKREKLSKNKAKEYRVKLNKSLLSDFLRDSVEDSIACDNVNKTKQQENKAFKSTIDNMFNTFPLLYSGTECALFINVFDVIHPYFRAFRYVPQVKRCISVQF